LGNTVLLLEVCCKDCFGDTGFTGTSFGLLWGDTVDKLTKKKKKKKTSFWILFY
jgi:hypothetical protein